MLLVWGPSSSPKRPFLKQGGNGLLRNNLGPLASVGDETRMTACRQERVRLSPRRTPLTGWTNSILTWSFLPWTLLPESWELRLCFWLLFRFY